MSAVWQYFKDVPGLKMAQFRDEWAQLSDEDKTALKTGVADGSFTY